MSVIPEGHSSSAANDSIVSPTVRIPDDVKEEDKQSSKEEAQQSSKEEGQQSSKEEGQQSSKEETQSSKIEGQQSNKDESMPNSNQKENGDCKSKEPIVENHMTEKPDGILSDDHSSSKDDTSDSKTNSDDKSHIPTSLVDMMNLPTKDSIQEAYEVLQESSDISQDTSSKGDDFFDPPQTDDIPMKSLEGKDHWVSDDGTTSCLQNDKGISV